MADFTGAKADIKLGFFIGIGLALLGIVLSLFSGLIGRRG